MNETPTPVSTPEPDNTDTVEITINWLDNEDEIIFAFLQALTKLGLQMIETSHTNTHRTFTIRRDDPHE